MPTRFPVRAVRTLDLSFRSFEPSGTLNPNIDCDGETRRVVATHLWLGSREGRPRGEQALQSFDTPAMPVILLGDLNEWSIYGRTLRRLVSHVHRARSPRISPKRYPLFALDRI